MGQINVDIFGSCVPRDTFRYDTEKIFAVKNFFSFISPLSLMMSGLKNDFEITFDSMTPWYNRNYIHDLKKDVFDSLEKSDSNYLIMDVADVRYPISVYSSNGEPIHVTCSRPDIHYKDNLLSNVFDNNYDKISPLKLTWEDVEKALRAFSESILKCYPSEKIILIKSVLTRGYIDEKKIVKFEDSSEEMNDLMKKTADFMESCLSCFSIDIPVSAVSNPKHIWGLDKLHYTDDVYDYIFKSIKYFVEKNDPTLSCPPSYTPKIVQKKEIFIHGGKSPFKLSNVPSEFYKEYEIRHVTTQTSPLTNSKVSLKYDFKTNFPDLGKGIVALLEEDANKTMFQKIKKERPDFFVLDALDSRIPICKIFNDGSTCEVTGSTHWEKVSEKVVDDSKVEQIFPMRLPMDELTDRVFNYCVALKQAMGEGKVILFKAMYPSHYIDDSGKEIEFSNNNKVNLFLKVVYLLFEEFLNPACVIDGKFTAASKDDPWVLIPSSEERIRNEILTFFTEMQEKES